MISGEVFRGEKQVKALVIVAHGSRRASSNDEVRALAQQVAQAQSEFHDVSSAFLELAEPLIPDGVEQAILRGAMEVVVMPYFLSAGRHVVSDIPAEVAKVSDKYPHIPISIAPYLGSSQQMASLVLQQSNL